MFTDTRLSACIVLYQSNATVLNTVQSVMKSEEPIDLYLVDNDPAHSIASVITDSYPQVQLIQEKKNVGFGRAHNELCGRLHSRYHLILNPDVTFDPDLLGRMVEYMEAHRDIAILTPRIFFPDGKEQFVPRLQPNFLFLLSGLLENWPFFKGQRRRYTMQDAYIPGPMRVGSASGCFLLIRTQVFYKLKGFDPHFFMYMEDCDLSKRAQEYGHVVYHPDFCVTHAWNRADKRDARLLWEHVKSAVRFLNKWGW